MFKILIIFFFIHSGMGFAQMKYNLVADFYPNHIPSETGTELEEFEDPLFSFNVLYIRNLNHFIEIDSSDIEISSLTLIYEKGKVDTNNLNPTNNATYIIPKDSIKTFSPVFLFINRTTKEEMYIQNLCFCENSKMPKYSIHLEEKSKNRMNYKLYFLPNCETERLNNENLIRYGEIKLRKKRS